MATGLKTYVHSSPRGGFLAVIQSIDLSVRAAKKPMIAFADDAAIADEDGSHDRVRLNSTSATLGQLQG
jgi:hypothetical protein